MQLNKGRSIEAHLCEARGSWATMSDRGQTAPATQKKDRQKPSEVDWAEVTVRSGDTHSGCRGHRRDTRSLSLSRAGPLTDLPPCLRIIRGGEEMLSMFRATGWLTYDNEPFSQLSPPQIQHPETLRGLRAVRQRGREPRQEAEHCRGHCRAPEAEWGQEVKRRRQHHQVSEVRWNLEGYTFLL